MLKETLERFREKFKSKTCDCDSICEIHKIEEYKQFITEELKQAMESIKLKHKTFPERESDEFDAGYNFAIDQINDNIKEFYEERTIL